MQTPYTTPPLARAPRRRSAVLTLALCAGLSALPWLPLAAHAAAGTDAAPSPEVLQRSLQGRWTGALQYRDYQSNSPFELPVVTQFSAAPDGVTLTRLSAFDDGPKTGTVYITTVSLFDAKTGQVMTATFRKGRAVEVWTDAVRNTAYRDAEHWTLVYAQRGSDNDKPADIRVTETRDGDSLLSLKEVKPAGAPDSAWAFRNQTRLQRQPAP